MADPNLNVNITGTDHLTGELKRVESGVIRFVGAVSAAMSAIAVIGFPIVESVKFQTALLDAARTTNYTAAQLGLMKEGLRDLSTQVNITAIDLAKIATLGGQMGIGVGNPEAMVAFVKTVSTAVSAMGLPAEEVVNSFGKLVNIFNLLPSQFDNAMSALTAVGNASAVTASQLFDVIQRVGDLGGSATLPQAAAMAAAMVDLGMSSEVAGTSLTKFFADFKAKASEFAIKVGMTTAEWINIVQTDGPRALSLYLASLNKVDVVSASMTKAQLTGQGRLFEGVSKLQNQAARQLSYLRLQADEERKIQELRTGGGSQREIDALQKKADAYAKLATQSNVVARLTKVAEDAYASGKAAQEAQAIILQGVAAQWTMFSNTVSKALGAIGDVALPPLTRMLTAMREALNDPVAVEGLRKASEDVLGYLEVIASALSSFQKVISGGGGFDWGALLHLAALGVGIAVIKGLGALFGALGRYASTASPAIAGLTAKLLGTSEASRKAAAAMAELNAQNVRSGGLIGRSGTQSTIAKDLAAMAAMEVRQNRLNAVTGEYANRLNAAQAAINQTYSAPALAKLQTIALVNQKILDIQTKLSAAQALGAAGNRSAGQYNGQLTRMQALQTTLLQQEATLTSLKTKADAYNKALLNNKLDLLGAGAKYNPGAYINGLMETGARAGKAMKDAFTSSSAGITTGMASAYQRGASLASNAITRFITGSTSVVVTGISRLTTGMATATQAGYLFTRNAILQATGYAEAWTNATTRVHRELIMAAAAAQGLFKAINAVIGLVGKIVTFVFLAEMAKDLLKMVGLWDGFSNAVRSFVGFFGGKAWAFFDSDQDIKNMTAEVARLQAKFAGAREEASKMTDTMRTSLEVLQNRNLVAQDVTFSPKNAGGAQDNVDKYFQALVVGYAAAENAAAGLAAVQARLKVASDPAERNALLAQQSLLQEQNDQYVTNKESLRNLIVTAADFETVEALSGVAVGENTSLLEKYANAKDNLADAERQLAKDTAAAGGAINSANDATRSSGAQLQLLQAAQSASTLKTQKLRDVMIYYKKEVEAAASKTGVLKGAITAMENSASTTSIVKMAQDMAAIRREAQQTGVAIQGLAVAKVAPIDLFNNIQAQKIVGNLQKVYQSAAEGARAAATATENSVEQSLRRVSGYATAAVEALQKINQAAKAMDQKAKDNVADKSADAETLKRINAVRQEFTEKRRALDADIARRNQYQQETASSRARDVADVQKLEAAEKKVIDAIQERADASKAVRGVQEQIAAISELGRSARFYREEIEKGKAALAKPDVSALEKIRLNDKLQEDNRKLAEAGKEAIKQSVDLIKTAPVGGIKLVTPEQVESARNAVNVLTELMSTGDAAVNDKSLTANYTSAAEELSAAAKTMATQMADLQKNFTAMMVTLGSSGPQLVALLQKSAEVSGLWDKIAADAASGANGKALDAAVAGTVNVTEFENRWNAAFLSVANKATDAFRGGVVVNLDDKGIREKTDVLIADLSTKLSAVGAKPTPVQTELAAGTGEKLNQQLDNLGLSVNVRANLVGPGATGRARGGLAEAPNPIHHFAGGGGVSGPGTGTSDSILSWLSNGEYVMDALTTSAFGPKFFSSLQAIARGGASGNFLRKLSLPTFAYGGPVSRSLPASIMGASAGAAAAAMSARSTVDINLNVGGSKVSLFGERQQADRLVQVLKRMEISA